MEPPQVSVVMKKNKWYSWFIYYGQLYLFYLIGSDKMIKQG